MDEHTEARDEIVRALASEIIAIANNADLYGGADPATRAQIFCVALAVAAGSFLAEVVVPGGLHEVLDDFHHNLTNIAKAQLKLKQEASSDQKRGNLQ